MQKSSQCIAPINLKWRKVIEEPEMSPLESNIQNTSDTQIHTVQANSRPEVQCYGNEDVAKLARTQTQTSLTSTGFPTWGCGILKLLQL